MCEHQNVGREYGKLMFLDVDFYKNMLTTLNVQLKDLMARVQLRHSYFMSVITDYARLRLQVTVLTQ